MALHHCSLCGMQLAVCSSQVFYRPQCHAVNGVGQPDAAVDCFELQLAIDCFAQHHSASAAVALAATFFGARGIKILAQHFKQRAGRWYIG